MTVATEDTIRTVVQEVLAQLGRRQNGYHLGTSANGDWGVFQTVDDAVSAATDAFEKLKQAPLTDREKAIACVKHICQDQAEELG